MLMTLLIKIIFCLYVVVVVEDGRERERKKMKGKKEEEKKKTKSFITSHAPSLFHHTHHYTTCNIPTTTITSPPTPQVLPLEAPNLRPRPEKRDRDPPDEVRIQRTKLFTQRLHR
jgi:hypothetical protein